MQLDRLMSLPPPCPQVLQGTYSILFSAHLHSERLFRDIFFFKVCGQESLLELL